MRADNNKQPQDLSWQAMTIHHAHRKTARPTVRRSFRLSLRSCLRGRGGPSDFTQMLTALGRAVRAHRQLARLAPSFFDAAVVDRERENRTEQQKWMATWEPYLAKAYGVPPELPVVAEVPRLPHPNTQRAVERRLAEMPLWLAAAHAARERHQQRRPHALPSLTQLARLLQLAFDLKYLALGLNSPNRLPDKITYDYELTDLKRGYGHLLEPEPSASGGASVPASRSTLAADSPAVGDGEQRCPLGSPPPALATEPPAAPRCDAWRRLARQMRR